LKWVELPAHIPDKLGPTSKTVSVSVYPNPDCSRHDVWYPEGQTGSSLVEVSLPTKRHVGDFIIWVSSEAAAWVTKKFEIADLLFGSPWL
jgi:hypothetical protein